MTDAGDSGLGEPGSVTPATGPAGALGGVRVLDAGILMQGPVAAQMLGDLGAEVIKVEMPDVGDPARHVPTSTTDRRPPWFVTCNRDKSSVCIDLRTPRGAELLLALGAVSDVVISNFTPGTMDGWGLSYTDFGARNPRIIYATGSTWGERGDRADLQGLDLIGQAGSGLVSRQSSGGPVGATLADHAAGTQLAAAIMAALFERTTSGLGQHVSASIVGGMIAAQSAEIVAHGLAGDSPAPSAQGHPLLREIYGVFGASDGQVAIAKVPDHRMVGFWSVLGLRHLARNPRFLGRMDRAALEEAFDHISGAMSVRTVAEWGDAFDRLGLIWSPVRTYGDVITDDHSFSEGLLQRLDHPAWGPTVLPGSPIGMSRTPTRPGQSVPVLGQDTGRVLGALLGLDSAQLGKLARVGVISGILTP